MPRCSCFVQSYMNFVQGSRSPFSFLWAFLVPVSWLAGLWIGMADFLYRHGLKRSCEPPIPVVSVGNLTYGGTNKTPFVEMLCRAMREKGIPVGIVSRGYGGDSSDTLILRGGKPLSVPTGGDIRRAVGDEPLLLSSRLPDIPVAVSRDRVRGIRELARGGTLLAIADDAFQHRRLMRDADVVLIDAACPFGSGRPIPAGVLRESPSALKRAHIVVVTKADQVAENELAALHREIEKYVPEDRIFDARLTVAEWALWDGGEFHAFRESVRGRRLMSFSAIGNPASFTRSLAREGALVAGERRFRDHHLYSDADMREICAQMRVRKADFLTCTEKDIHNLPPSWKKDPLPVPLLVPRVAVVLDEPGRFAGALRDCLRPRIVVASNGYGEDSVGVLLAEKARVAFPEAEVLAFPLVGRGEPYKKQGIPVISTPSVTPSGGVLKYHWRDLWRDLRAGLLGHIRAQQGDWRGVARRVRTPLCVGDVYLMLHTIWGQGTAPLFIATAKTVFLSGHWWLERVLIRSFCRRTWARDSGTAEQLGNAAAYAGSPIMDLLGNARPDPERPEPPEVLLLPGSRDRAYEDVKLLLDAVEILRARHACAFVMVLAPTIEPSRLAAACEGWNLESGNGLCLTKGHVVIRLRQCGVGEAAAGASVLIGLGGTANQLCAGMGIPVVSIDEKGKRVQKKLLGDAEILTEPTPGALAGGALKILTTPALREKMSAAGRERMGKPGALDSVIRYAAEELGWKTRCEVSAAVRGSDEGR
ncbi:MAG: tetraacyldisaccharide 4'-kinase [Synergistaceae bacterium]|nr:tetraacyldisaccharide 4'-kinase [Synergistaceae bacterium]